ncbi:MAG: hypothetical protein KGQ16_13760 [Cyanobacteria bacterium REEB444]|nr:hypothetical protein [Cyanobacteria bacterium REEB444]
MLRIIGLIVGVYTMFPFIETLALPDRSAYVLPLSFQPLQVAQAATRIQFAKGSYCGFYSGNFSRGKEFILNLGRGQTFITRNIGGGTQYDVSVSGPNGAISGRRISNSQIEYYIPVRGDYYLYIESTVKYSGVEFCAY